MGCHNKVDLSFDNTQVARYMMLPFPKKYKYILLNDISSVRSDIKSIIRTPWYDISVNLYGKISDDNSFKLKSKFSIGVFSLVLPTTISGKLFADGEKTIIHAEVSGDGLLLSIFFISLIFFLFRIIKGFSTYLLYDWIITAGILLIAIAIGWYINFCIWRLKNRFEKVMMIHPEIENE